VPGEAELTGRGVSSCAWCDGGLFRGESVVVAGGGDAAAQEALHLLELGVAVTLVTRGTRLRARAAYAGRLADDPRARFRWNSTVESVLGSTGVTAVRIRNGESGVLEEVACAGLFVFVGLEPNSEWLPAEIARDAAGRVEIDRALRTSDSRVLAIGAVRAGYGGALASAIGEGAEAGAAAAS
jgi:thioredoxin reductase (NADPH)